MIADGFTDDDLDEVYDDIYATRQQLSDHKISSMCKMNNYRQ